MPGYGGVSQPVRLLFSWQPVVLAIFVSNGRHATVPDPVKLLQPLLGKLSQLIMVEVGHAFVEFASVPIVAVERGLVTGLLVWRGETTHGFYCEGLEKRILFFIRYTGQALMYGRI